MRWVWIRRLGPFAPALMVVWPVWAACVTAWDLWGVVAQGKIAAATMVFGALIAGATAEGGGAVAFPVFTLALKIKPVVARDFSWLIQSIGMTSAAAVIVSAKIPVSGWVIRRATLSGACGALVSALWLAPRLSGPAVKIFFVSAWLGLGFALWLIERRRDRVMRRQVGGESLGPVGSPLVLLMGVLGGVVSGLVGSGLDLIMFATIVLALRLDERVATPTSVIVMALNSVIGCLVVGVLGPILRPGHTGLAPEAVAMWLAAVPVVCVMAPLGALLIRDRPRALVLGLLWCSMIAQYVGALALLPTMREPAMVAGSAVTILVTSLIFYALGALGARSEAA